MKKISTFVLSICILMFSSSCQKESSTTKLDDSMSKVRDIVGGSGNLIALNEKDIFILFTHCMYAKSNGGTNKNKA